MINQFPFLVVGIPLFTALITGSIGVFYPSIVRLVSLVGIILATLASMVLFTQVLDQGLVTYIFGNWQAPYGIEYSIDALNALMIVLVYIVSLLAFIYSIKSVSFEIDPTKHHHYYTLFFLLITGLVGITITGDAFNLYVLIEICALSYYALLALGDKKSYMATFNYLLIGSIGACFYLLGVGYLFIKTGTLNMAQLGDIISGLFASKSILIGFIFINLGLFIKMALFPFHGWLPNIYSKAPITTCCLLAPLMTKLTIYVLLRMYFTVFSVEYVFGMLDIGQFMVWLATIAIIVGSLYTIIHTSFRRVVTYIVVAEIGYLVGGIWLGTRSSMVASIYHIVADSLMTLSLFMIVGMIIFYLKSDSMSKVATIFKQLPYTAISLVIVFASIIGIPPTSGFFTKFYLIKGALEVGQWHFVIALLFSSFVGVFILFRLVESYFFTDISSDLSVIKEDKLFVGPMLVTSFLIVFLGVTFNYWFNYISAYIPLGVQ